MKAYFRYLLFSSSLDPSWKQPLLILKQQIAASAIRKQSRGLLPAFHRAIFSENPNSHSHVALLRNITLRMHLDESERTNPFVRQFDHSRTQTRLTLAAHCSRILIPFVSPRWIASRRNARENRTGVLADVRVTWLESRKSRKAARRAGGSGKARRTNGRMNRRPSKTAGRVELRVEGWKHYLSRFTTHHLRMPATPLPPLLYNATADIEKFVHSQCRMCNHEVLLGYLQNLRSSNTHLSCYSQFRIIPLYNV